MSTRVILEHIFLGHRYIHEVFYKVSYKYAYSVLICAHMEGPDLRRLEVMRFDLVTSAEL